MSNEEKIEKVTDLILDMSHADKAVCAKADNPNISVCTFIKNDEPMFTLGLGNDKGKDLFYHYRGNNKDLGLRYYQDDKIDEKVELFKHSDFSSGGACFSKNRFESYPIPHDRCIIETSGLHEAVSRDGAYISINEELESS